jgi:hypothetical protein
MSPPQVSKHSSQIEWRWYTYRPALVWHFGSAGCLQSMQMPFDKASCLVMLYARIANSSLKLCGYIITVLLVITRCVIRFLTSSPARSPSGQPCSQFRALRVDADVAAKSVAGKGVTSTGPGALLQPRDGHVPEVSESLEGAEFCRFPRILKHGWSGHGHISVFSSG